MPNKNATTAGGHEVGFAKTHIGEQLLTVLADGSPSSRQIADFLLRNPFRVISWGIEELAEKVGVSTASISRFARSMGFTGFPALRTELAGNLHTVLEPVEKLRAQIERGPTGGSAVRESISYSAANLQSAAHGLSDAVCDALVKRLTKAKIVYVMGFGLSAHVAGSLTLGLQPFCQQVINVVEFGGTEVAAGRLVDIGSDDVLIVISLPRYSTHALQLTRFARDRAAHIVAITDSPASPFAALAHDLLVANSEHPILSSSFVTALAMSEALVAGLLVSNPDNVSRAERLTEAISAYLVDTQANEPKSAKGSTGAKRAKSQRSDS